MSFDLPELLHEVSLEVQINIVQQDLQMWLNTRFQLQIRHRVNKTLGNDDAAKSITEELVKVEQAIGEYTKILTELQIPIMVGKNGRG